MDDYIPNAVHRDTGPTVAVFIYCVQCGTQAYLGTSVHPYALKCSCGGEIRHVTMSQRDIDEMGADGLTVKELCDKHRLSSKREIFEARSDYQEWLKYEGIQQRRDS